MKHNYSKEISLPNEIKELLRRPKPLFENHVGLCLSLPKIGFYGICYGIYWDEENWRYLLKMEDGNSFWFKEDDVEIRFGFHLNSIKNNLRRFDIEQIISSSANNIQNSEISGFYINLNKWFYRIKKDVKYLWIPEDEMVEHEILCSRKLVTKSFRVGL